MALDAELLTKSTVFNKNFYFFCDVIGMFHFDKKSTLPANDHFRCRADTGSDDRHAGRHGLQNRPGKSLLDNTLPVYYPVRMSTGSHNRFAELAKLGEVVFHTDDLANLWRISNKNTLYTTIKRYVQQGLLVRLQKGFYAIKSPAEIDPLLLGIKALHGYAYVSTETILASEGVIQQEVPAITLISSTTKRFTIAGHSYYSRKLADEFLFRSDGILVAEQGVRKAAVPRAIADMLFVNPHAYFDADNLINWKTVQELQKKIGYPLTPQRYG